MRTDGQTDRYDASLIVAFRNFANVPKMFFLIVSFMGLIHYPLRNKIVY
jgi:hypothetical protein